MLAYARWLSMLPAQEQLELVGHPQARSLSKEDREGPERIPVPKLHRPEQLELLPGAAKAQIGNVRKLQTGG
eukprot:symbB.v1.2.028394.t1/scaffold3007.1/size65499/4